MTTGPDRRARPPANGWLGGSACAAVVACATVVAACDGAGITTPARGTGRGSDEAREGPPDAGPTRIGPSPTPPSSASDAAAPPPPPPAAPPLPASCEEVAFTPCGGDPIGMWTVRLGCVDFEGRSPFETCPDARVEVAIALTGTMTIRDGGTYSSATDITSTSTARVPPACAMDDCSGLGEDAMLEGGVCVQTVMDHQMPTDEGVWRFEGGLVVLQTDAESTRYQVCVEGDRMTLYSPAPGPNDSAITLVLERM